MADKYYNFEELAANEVEGVDYTITSILRPPSHVSSIAVHGGGIEIGTTELAREVAGLNAHNYYSFEAIKASGNSDLHLTSVHYDEPEALHIQDQSDFTISFHGAAGDISKSLMGGLDVTKRDSLMAALNSSGFTAELASEELNGNSSSNIANRNRTRKCVQIELTTQQRRDFFIGEDWSRDSRLAGNFTDDFFRYVEIVAAETAKWETETLGSPNYRFNLAKPGDLMSDFDLWVNSNYTKIEGIPAATVVVTPELPTDIAQFAVGDRIYHTATKSIYIAVAVDPNWGVWWRPVQAAMSPWVDVPLTAVTDSINWNIRPFPTRPLQIALDNTGMVHWRGVVSYIGGGNITKYTSYHPFYEMPFGFRPRETDNYWVGHQSINVGATDWEGVRVYIPDDVEENISIRAQGGDPAALNLNQLYFNGCVQYAMGSGHYVIP